MCIWLAILTKISNIKIDNLVQVAEVKGPGDTLSSKQKLWLDFFMKQDQERVEAFVAKVSGEILFFYRQIEKYW